MKTARRKLLSKTKMENESLKENTRREYKRPNTLPALLLSGIIGLTSCTSTGRIDYENPLLMPVVGPIAAAVGVCSFTKALVYDMPKSIIEEKKTSGKETPSPVDEIVRVTNEQKTSPAQERHAQTQDAYPSLLTEITTIKKSKLMKKAKSRLMNWKK